MSQHRDIARQILTEQVLDATSLEEVQTARAGLRAWIAAYPEEREWMRDGFEQLAQMEEIAQAQFTDKPNYDSSLYDSSLAVKDKTSPA